MTKVQKGKGILKVKFCLQSRMMNDPGLAIPIKDAYRVEAGKAINW